MQWWLSIFVFVFRMRSVWGFNDLNTGQLDGTMNETLKEMPRWPGLLPLSLCTLALCEDTLGYLFQEQRKNAYPIHEAVIEGPSVLYPRKDTLINSDDKKYLFHLLEGVRLTRKFATVGDGRNLFYQIVEPIANAKCVLIWLLGTELVGDAYLTVAQSFALHRGISTILIDWESFSRSSGLYYYTEDVEQEADRVLTLLDRVLPTVAGSSLKIFIRGDGVGSLRAITLCASEAKRFEVAGLVVGGFSPKLADSFLTVPTWLAKGIAQVGYTIHPLWPIAPTEDLGEFALRNYNELHAYFKHDSPFHLNQMRSGVLHQYLSDSLSDFWRYAPKLNMPILALVAGNDKVASNEQTDEFFLRVASKDKDIFTIEGAEHAEVLLFNLHEHWDAYGKFYEKAFMDSTNGESAFHFKLIPEQVAIAAQAENKFYAWLEARL